jgi:hypothetical protein
VTLYLLLLLGKQILVRARHVWVDLIQMIFRVGDPGVVRAAAVPFRLAVHAGVHVHAVGSNRLHVLLVEGEALALGGVLVVACKRMRVFETDRCSLSLG